MRAPRGLSEEERAAWSRLAQSVTPLEGKRRPPPPADNPVPVIAKIIPAKRPAQRSAPPKAMMPAPSGGLDSSWERKLARAGASPDFTLDLHGLGLDAAYNRLNDGMAQAIAQGARLLLVIAGKARPSDPADRGHRRGAIRAKMLDWIAAGPHAGAVAAVRPAHRKHGGEGALYIVLRRR